MRNKCNANAYNATDTSPLSSMPVAAHVFIKNAANLIPCFSLVNLRSLVIHHILTGSWRAFTDLSQKITSMVSITITDSR